MFSLGVNFIRCQKGVTAIIFAVALVPFLIIVGAAINYADANSKEAMVQELMDSSVLAAASAKDVTDAERVKIAQKHFMGAMPSQLADLSKQVAFSVNDGDVTGTIRTTVPSPIMGLFGLANAELNQKAVATFKEDNRQLDMVFCIDATASMQPTIDAVRSNAVALQKNLNEELKQRKLSEFAGMRVRVIFFRDYGYDQGDPKDSANKPAVAVRYFVDKNYVQVSDNQYAPVNPLMRTLNPNERYMPVMPETGRQTDTVEVAVDNDIETMSVNEAVSAGIINPFPGASNMPAIRESKGGDFYILSPGTGYDESDDFQAFVGQEKAYGGGDEPESSFACLNKAIRSNWAHVDLTDPSKSDDLAGHPGHKINMLIPLIVMWTDANALPLDGMSDALSERNSFYPSSSYLPRSVSGLTALWNDEELIDQRNKLFVFFGDKDNDSSMCYGNKVLKEGKLVADKAGPDCTSYRSTGATARWHALDGWQKSEKGGSLTEGNTQLVKKLVDALATSPAMPRLID